MLYPFSRHDDDHLFCHYLSNSTERAVLHHFKIFSIIPLCFLLFYLTAANVTPVTGLLRSHCKVKNEFNDDYSLTPMSILSYRRKTIDSLAAKSTVARLSVSMTGLLVSQEYNIKRTPMRAHACCFCQVTID